MDAVWTLVGVVLILISVRAWLACGPKLGDRDLARIRRPSDAALGLVGGPAEEEVTSWAWHIHLAPVACGTVRPRVR
jgi:hypothetical protein